MKKTFISIFALLVLALPWQPAKAVATASVTVLDKTVKQNAIIEIDVKISGNPGIAAWQFDVTWDSSALTLSGDEPVAVGEPFSSGTLLSSQTDNGVAVSWFAIKNIEEDGVLFRFFLTATGSAGEYPLTITCSPDNTINVNETPVPVSSASCTITIVDDGTEPKPEPDHEAPPNPFTDVRQDSYYYEPVLWAVRQGITNGTSSTSFSPNKTCTRAQVVTFLWRAAGNPEPSEVSNPFSDVSSDSYYYKAVLWAAENGITGGTSPTTFSPNGTVTRAQVVTFLWRMAGGQQSDDDLPFTDIEQGKYYSTAVRWAIAGHITGGTSPTTFSPASGCTRAQITTFLYRYYVS